MQANPAQTETLSPALPDDVERAALQVLERARAAGLKLATAESCTGGLLASLLTDIDGYGHVFERGFVTYGDQAKCDLLGLARQQIEDCGAVSREVALAMAEGAVRRSAAQVAVAVTGFAGPAGAGDEEGLVHFACAREGRSTIHREAHFGARGRGPIRICAVQTALDMLAAAMKS